MFKRTAIMSVALVGCLSAAHATTIFSEGFSGSTVMSATPAAPTATTTDYAVMSSKNATGSSVLNLGLSSGTSAGYAEMQALFTSSPVTLGAGQSITLQMTFQGTLLLDSASANQTLNVGLYNSGGVMPVPGGQMANGGMGSGTTFPTGYAQNWEGYVGRVGSPAGNSSSIYTRDAQTDTVNENQDLLFSNSGTGAYDTPTGTAFASGNQTNLMDATDYTLLLTVLNSGAGVQVSQNIYEGIGTGGAIIHSMTGTAGTEYTTFDSLAFGARFSAASAPSIAVSALQVDVIPEPASIALIGVAGAGVLFVRRRFMI